jgi:hypothetical protein
VVDVHRYHEISEVDHRILNPLALDQLVAIGDICGLRVGHRHLDLASGAGEMLCQYARMPRPHPRSRTRSVSVTRWWISRACSRPFIREDPAF